MIEWKNHSAEEIFKCLKDSIKKTMADTGHRPTPSILKRKSDSPNEFFDECVKTHQIKVLYIA